MSDKTTLYVKKRKTVTVPGKGSQFRALLQGMYDAVLLMLLTDLKGRIEDFNDRAIRFFQYRREEMENLAIGDSSRKGVFLCCRRPVCAVTRAGFQRKSP